MTDDVDNKDAKIAELEARIKALEIKTQPPPKVAVAARMEGHAPSTYRLIDQMSVPQHILREMQACVPDDVVREIAKDARRR